MYCCLCKTELICYDDVNNIGLRLDFMKCPQCGVKADIILSSGELKNVKSVSFYWEPVKQMPSMVDFFEHIEHDKKKAR